MLEEEIVLYIKKIDEIIRNGNFNVLKELLKNNDYDFFKNEIILFEVVRKNVPFEIIQFIVNHININADSYIILTDTYYKPLLYYPILNQNFKLAKFLFDKLETTIRTFDFELIRNLILNKKYDISSLKYLINDIINQYQKCSSEITAIIKLLKYFFYEYDSTFDFLYIYKNRIPLSREQLKEKLEWKIDQENCIVDIINFGYYEWVKNLHDFGFTFSFINNKINIIEPLIKQSLRNDEWYSGDYSTISLLKILLDNGLNVNSMDKEGKTLLSYAYEIKDYDLIKFLLESNANNAQCLINNLDFLKDLIVKDFKNNTDKYSILHKNRILFFHDDDFDDYKLYVDLCGNCYYFDYLSSGKVLYYNKDMKYFDILKLLVKNHLNINIKDNEGKTLLMYALHTRNKRIIYYLIIHGAEIRLTYNNLSSLLEHFKRFEIIHEVLIYLFKHKTNMECFKENMELILLLNNFEEEENTYEEENTSKSNILEDNNSMILFKYDEINNSNIEKKLMQNILRILIENHLDFNMKDKNGKTLLMYIMVPSNNFILRKYFKNITDTNSSDNSGKSLLMYACKFYNFELVKYLVEHGGDINKKDNNGKTSLMYSCQSRNNYQIVKYLIKNGAKINCSDNTGKTPLIYAMKCKNNEIVDYLLDYGADETEVPFKILYKYKN